MHARGRAARLKARAVVELALVAPVASDPVEAERVQRQAAVGREAHPHEVCRRRSTAP
jgi:hypothetical protein